MGNEFLPEGDIYAGATVEGDFADHGDETTAFSPKVRLPIYVMGWIDYTDESGIPRRTVFCRKYHFDERRFVPVKNPDYERED